MRTPNPESGGLIQPAGAFLLKLRAQLCVGLCLLAWLPGTVHAGEADHAGETGDAISLVVMDPLAAPLSCPCVEGYAQRRYDKFAAALSERVGRRVVVTFAESLENALEKEQCNRIDIVIGKDSVVRADLAALKLAGEPTALLTGRDGKTTQTGLVVVPHSDPAKNVADLAGYRVIYGPTFCAEKFTAARELLDSAGVSLTDTEKCEFSSACSDGATKILELGSDVRAATVISSYAAPLLEGCGTIKKGDLRVVGTTGPVPFVTAFITENIPPDQRPEFAKALVQTSRDAEMLVALESLVGFVPLNKQYKQWHKSHPQRKPNEVAPSKATSSIDWRVWPGWGGPARNGQCRTLPATLPAKPRIVWTQRLAHEGLGGIAATDKIVVVGDRDFSNQLDEFRCFDASTGKPKWVVRYPAPGKLDYDNSPRATPLLTESRAYLLGAFGDLSCADAKLGLVYWRKNLIRDFGANPKLIWGTCSSPLLDGQKLIFNPGAPEAAWVACNATTGSPLWKSPGGQHAYASPIVATVGGRRQLIAYERQALVGFDVETGARLWTHKPKVEGDFNVPTPLVYRGKLILCSENNGARLHQFDQDGKLIDEPVARYGMLSPDMSSPVVIGNRLFCMSELLYCLDLENGLKEIWVGEDDAFGDFAPLLASEDRLLVAGRGGELLLVDPLQDEMRVVSRTKPLQQLETGSEVTYAAPALVGSQLYMRVGRTLACVTLDSE